MPNHKLLSELRRLAADNNGIEDRLALRLILAAVADIYEEIGKWNKHCHEDTNSKLAALERRDWLAVIGAALTALGAAIVAYLAR